MEKNISKMKKLLLVVLLCCAAGCLLMMGCGACDSCVNSCSVLRSVWTPEMSLTDNGRTPMPVITGSRGSEELTVLLEEHYGRIAETIELANQTEDMFSLAHELVLAGDSYYLHSAIICSEGGQLNLPRIHIPYAGETVIPEWSVPGQLEGAKQTAAWLELTANGVNFDLSRMDDQFSASDVLRIYIDYYRKISGLDIDVSRFSEAMEYDQLCREAIVLGLVDGEYTYDLSSVDPVTLLGMSADLLSAMYNDACGKGSTGFTEEEMLSVLDIFISMSPAVNEQWVFDTELFGRLLDDRLADCCRNNRTYEQTRMSVAASLVSIYEMMYGPIELYENAHLWLCDTEDESCIKANHMSIMGVFPKDRQFAPDYVPGRYLLPEFVDGFIYRSMLDRTEGLWDYSITGSEVMQSLAAVDICVRRAGVAKTDPQVLVNTRDYDWYYTQHGTGLYSSINCMPTIAMMATKWFNKDTDVTIEEMRERYLPDIPGGWFTWQVAETLTENGVPNELVDVSEDMLPYLNDGKIILSQMSESAYGESGHCFVIYGYWKRGDTIKYYVHDPDVYDGTDAFGQRPGRAILLDGHYCKWIIDRFAFSYIVVG